MIEIVGSEIVKPKARVSAMKKVDETNTKNIDLLVLASASLDSFRNTRYIIFAQMAKDALDEILERNI